MREVGTGGPRSIWGRTVLHKNTQWWQVHQSLAPARHTAADRELASRHARRGAPPQRWEEVLVQAFGIHWHDMAGAPDWSQRWSAFAECAYAMAKVRCPEKPKMSVESSKATKKCSSNGLATFIEN